MDFKTLRDDFPVLSSERYGDGLIYFDNACMTLRPKQVIDKIMEYYQEYPGCGGRSLHKVAGLVTDGYEGAREKVKNFINAEDVDGIIFTKNTTEAVNLVSRSFPFKKGDKVLGTDHEHNSNLVPWVFLHQEGKIRYEPVPSLEDNIFDVETFKEMIPGTRMVTMVHVSNLDGTMIPEKEIIEISHDEGAVVMLDCAQSIPHMPVDMKDWNLDLLVFSGHKACGPTGTGVLAGKMDVINELKPFLIGGDTVKETTYDRVEFLPPPKKFEAGLQNYAGFIGLGAALDYLKGVGLNEIHEHEIELNSYATGLLKDRIRIVGPLDAKRRGGILPFQIESLNPHDVAMMLDELANIAIRSGRHCVHSWFNSRGEDSTARASFYLYNTKDEVKKFSDTLEDIMNEFT
jgi:cysteine desulfurase/selenocysteine lyase